MAGIPSRWVYSYLAYWIRIGVVRVERDGGINIYVLADWARRVAEFVTRVLRRGRDARLRMIVENLARSRLYRSLSEAERALIAVLVERILYSTSPYLRVRGENPQQAVDALRDKLWRRLRAMGLDPAAAGRELMHLEDSLEELAEAGIIYMHWDRRHRVLVLRLDTSLEMEAKRLARNRYNNG